MFCLESHWVDVGKSVKQDQEWGNEDEGMGNRGEVRKLKENAWEKIYSMIVFHKIIYIISRFTALEMQR